MNRIELFVLVCLVSLVYSLVMSFCLRHPVLLHSSDDTSVYDLRSSLCLSLILSVFFLIHHVLVWHISSYLVFLVSSCFPFGRQAARKGCFSLRRHCFGWPAQDCEWFLYKTTFTRLRRSKRVMFTSWKGSVCPSSYSREDSFLFACQVTWILTMLCCFISIGNTRGGRLW